MRHRLPREFWDQRFEGQPYSHKPSASAPLASKSFVSGSRRNDLYVPHSYEPNYPYPLIVWLDPPTTGPAEFSVLMSAISPQNYLGLTIRGPQEAGPTWLPQVDGSVERGASSILENEVRRAVCELRRRYHVHSERIYLAGFDDGATSALHLLLFRPEWFAGAVVLGGNFSLIPNPLRRFRELSGKRVLFGPGLQVVARPDRRAGRGAFGTTFADSGHYTQAEVSRTARLLHAAGLDVTIRLDNADRELTPERLKPIDHWLLQGVPTAV